MNPNIKIICWTGKILYQGPHNSPEVDTVLDANRCACVDDAREFCKSCDGSGYSGDFHVEWEDSNIDDNVYEAINY
ncbi:MAG: hypothetical protein RJA83_347 [Pseudomonadota bacterium]|jgi:hypothetical protein